jgi:hypothetical protein
LKQISNWRYAITITCRELELNSLAEENALTILQPQRVGFS